MKHGLKTIDCDLHVQEPKDLWINHIDPAFRSRAPRGIDEFSRDPALEIDGRIVPKNRPLARVAVRNDDRYAFAAARRYDARSQLEAMDAEGLDVAALFPTMGLFALAVDGMDPALSAAIAHAYNVWLHKFCAEDPKRLLGVALISPHNVEAAVVEARHAVKELGFKGIFMRPNPINGRYWDHSYYAPLWAELERLEVPICFHEGGSGASDLPVSQMGDWFDNAMLGHVVSHPFGVMHACVSLVLGGVLERHPRLRAAFFEGNCSWAPWLIWRMDEHFEWWSPANLKRTPSEIFRQQCYTSIEVDEDPGVPAVQFFDGKNICVSTDYPHGDSKFPHAIDRFFKLPLAEHHRRRILWDNTAELYQL